MKCRKKGARRPFGREPLGACGRGALPVQGGTHPCGYKERRTAEPRAWKRPPTVFPERGPGSAHPSQVLGNGRSSRYDSGRFGKRGRDRMIPFVICIYKRCPVPDFVIMKKRRGEAVPDAPRHDIKSAALKSVTHRALT